MKASKLGVALVLAGIVLAGPALAKTLKIERDSNDPIRVTLTMNNGEMVHKTFTGTEKTITFADLKKDATIKDIAICKEVANGCQTVPSLEANKSKIMTALDGHWEKAKIEIVKGDYKEIKIEK